MANCGRGVFGVLCVTARILDGFAALGELVGWFDAEPHAASSAQVNVTGALVTANLKVTSPEPISQRREFPVR